VVGGQEVWLHRTTQLGLYLATGTLVQRAATQISAQ
jgi:hypothetical protein